MSTETLEREPTALTLVDAPEHTDALAMFTTKDGSGVDPLLTMVRSKIDVFLQQRPDVTTRAGRDLIRAFAHRITKSKTALEGVRKTLADEQKEIPKLIDATGRRIKSTLDEWHDEVRKPLTDWEAAEEARLNVLKANLTELQAVIDDRVDRTSEALRDRLGEIEADFATISADVYGDYTAAATELKAKAVEALKARIGQTEIREAEVRELAQLRKESEERARKDREAEIAQKAAEKAKADAAEAVARAERDKAAAEQRAVDAARKAREDAEKEIIDRQNAEAEETRRREQDRENRARVHRAALEAFTAAGIADETAREVIKLIATGKVPAIRITY